MSGFSTRKLLILGATSAIAIETARIYATSRSDLYLVGRDKEKLDSLSKDLLVRGANSVKFEVRDLKESDNGKEFIDNIFDKIEIDTVLVAYGSLNDQDRCTKEFDLARDEIETNFLSVVSYLTAISERFSQKGSGAIAVISSVAGDRGRQSNYVYGSAKGALSIYLSGLRNRLYRKGVNVLTIKPGFVDTPMTSNVKKGPLFVNADIVGRGIARAIEDKKDVVYLPWFWSLIMFVIRSIPESIFKRLRL